ncbi:hypothetical protein FSP39_010017 [Pinctada imbricata]|uniref:Cerebral cavernous malformations 2 harmonin-homology domain-containing protein n=1 Tax=Pinctada imbricata TaxID=66713 RepID=A0AA88XTP7_PINIB|nr:hypothetical protein FSP39_010017 [Pinctada imbricata]
MLVRFQFAGRIPEVPADVDVTNRTEVLRIIDRGKMEKVISQHVETTQDAIISLCKSNLKLSYRDNMETLIMRIPTHEIAAICYIRDDGLNLLAIKHCMSRSQHDLQKIANSRGKRTESSANSEASVQSSVQAELVKACLGELPSIFTLEELTQFSTLIKNINEPTMQQFHEFCDSMYRLYGPERQHKLAGLSPFIPESKYPYFAEFLKKHGIQIPENGHGTLSSRHSYPRIYTRSISDISTTNDQSDLDSVLDNISTQLAQIDHNIGDVKPYLYQ